MSITYRPPASEAWQDFVAAWLALYGTDPVPVHELLKLAIWQGAYLGVNDVRHRRIFGRLLTECARAEVRYQNYVMRRRTWPGTWKPYQPPTWALEEAGS